MRTHLALATTIILLLSIGCSGGSPIAGSERALCSSELIDGRESDVDCGGPVCDACINGLACLINDDCESGACSSGKCVPLSCVDGVQGEDETDIDCGGGTCAGCDTGGTCTSAVDCGSAVCALDFCQVATCWDGVANGDEGGVDCGGSCTQNCGTGSECNVGPDCTDGVCVDGLCAAPACDDGVANGTETGTDCGGTCAPCAQGSGCVVTADCADGACIGGICVPDTCTNGTQDGTETGLDCGGAVCATCTAFGGCGGDTDCATRVCQAGTCAAEGFVATITRPNGERSILEGDTIDLEAEFSIAGQAVSPDSVTWSSNIDGVLGDGQLLLDIGLSAGVHTITMSAEIDGRTVNATATITVSSIAVRIINPDAGADQTVGATRDFLGAAETNLGGGIVALVAGAAGMGERTATFTWTSSLDGVLSTESNFSTSTLSVGLHTVSLVVADDQGPEATGLIGAASIQYVVRPPNDAPVVQITTPASCPQSIEAGNTIMLEATATDVEDGVLVGTWVDSMNGAATPGNTFEFGMPAALGKHTLTFVAIDSFGEASFERCSVFVTPSGGGTLFPDTGAVNDEVSNVGLPDNTTFISADSAGNTLVGTTEGLAVIVSGVATAYDGADLFGATGDPGIDDLSIVGETLFVATTDGLAECTYVAGVPSACDSAPGSMDTDYSSTDVAGSGNDFLFAAGSDGGGLLVGEYATGADPNPVTTIYEESDSNLPSNEVNDVVFFDGDLYVGTQDGLCVVQDPTGAAGGSVAPLCGVAVEQPLENVADAEIRAFAADGEFLWIGTVDGLARYNPASGSILVYGEDNGLPTDGVNDVAVDSAGIVWVGTDAGLSRINPAAGTITNFSGQDFGVGAISVSSVFIDGSGTKWIATSQEGILQYTGF